MGRSSKQSRFMTVAKKRQKRGPAKSKRWQRLAIISATFAAFSGVVGYGVFALYDASRQQATNNYTSLNKDVVGNLLNENIEPIVTEQAIAGEQGYSVSMGPIHIESAYNALFSKDELISMARWIYNNVNWGANGLSLQSITFTTGIDANTNSVTLGYHTSERSGSAIYLSPDAFERAFGITGKTISLLTKKIGKIGFDQNYTSFVNGLDLSNSLISARSKELDDTLTLTFNGVTIPGLETRGSYKSLTASDIKAILNLVVGDAYTDNYLTLTHNDLQGALATTQISDGIFTDPGRWLLALNRNKVDDYVNSGLERAKYVLAQRLFDASTNGASSLANAFWRIFLRRSLDDTASVAKLNAALDQVLLLPDLKVGNTQTYRLRPFQEWGAAWKNYLGYLSKDGSITNDGLNLRDMTFSLFSFYYQFASDFIDTNEGVKTAFKNLVNNRDLLFLKLWDSFINSAGSSYREGGKIRYILKGSLDFPKTFLLSPGDNWLLDESEKWRLTSTNADDRQLSLSGAQPVLAEYVNDKTKITSPSGDGSTSSLSDFLRSGLIDIMRFTLSHEYGHHETLWQAWGYYDNTLLIYDDKTSAKTTSPINREVLNKFFRAASASPGLNNVAEVLKRSNDKFSDTWSPTLVKNDFVHYFPDQDGYSSNQTTLYRFEFDPVAGVINNREEAFVPRPYVNAGSDNTANTTSQLPGFVYVFNPASLSTANPIKKDPKLVLAIHPLSMLISYQQTKWFMEGKVQNSAWARENQVSMFSFREGTIFTSPTTAYAGRVSGDVLYDLETWVQSAIQGTAGSAEIVRQIDSLIGSLYNEIIAKYPNFFENTPTSRRLTDYQRSKVLIDYVISKTKEYLKAKANPTNSDLVAPGIYFAPETLQYMTYKPFDQVDDYWKEHDKNDLVAEGTIQLGSGISEFVDYTSSYAEFMTRYLNQLAYRPNYNKFLVKNSDLNYDVEELLANNDDWYNDMNMFQSYGVNFYNFDLNNKTNTNMSSDGARMVVWTQELLGLHSNIDLAGNMPMTMEGKIDFDAIDNAISSANIVEKVYRKNKTSEYSLWGWFTPEQAVKYKYMVLKDLTTGKLSSIPIYTKNTSNYFYYEDLTSNLKRKLNKNFVQWASEWTIGGDFANTVLAPGQHQVYFSAKNDGSELESPVAINFQEQKVVVHRNNNDYLPVLAQVTLTIDPLERKLILEVKK